MVLLKEGKFHFVFDHFMKVKASANMKLVVHFFLPSRSDSQYTQAPSAFFIRLGVLILWSERSGRAATTTTFSGRIPDA